VIAPIIDAEGDLDPVTITEPVEDPLPLIDPIIDTIEPEVPAEVEEVFEQS